MERDSQSTRRNSQRSKLTNCKPTTSKTSDSNGKRQSKPSKKARKGSKSVTNEPEIAPQENPIARTIHQNKELRRSVTAAPFANQANLLDYQNRINMPPSRPASEVSKLKSELNQTKKAHNKLEAENKKLKELSGDLEKENENLSKENTELHEKYQAALEKLKEMRSRRPQVKYERDLANRLITATKHEVWRTCKFITSVPQERKLTARALDCLRDPRFMFTGNKEKDEEMKLIRKEAIELYRSDCREALNDRRSYTQSQCKDRCLMKMVNTPGPDRLYEIDDIIRVATRDIPTEDEDKAEHDRLMDVFVFYWDELLPCVAGNVYWRDAIRHRQCITIANLKSVVCIPAGTEAMTVLLYENCAQKWINIFELKGGDLSNKTKIPKRKDHPEYLKFVAKYSDSASGQAKYGGWSTDGLQRYAELRSLIADGRKQDKVPNLEHACLTLVQAKNNIVVKPGGNDPPEDNNDSDSDDDSRRGRKKKRKATVEVDIGFDEE